MSFDHLWSGWRSQYIESVTEPGTGAGSEPSGDRGGPEHCVFCQLFAGAATLEERHIVWEGPDAVVLLNAYPYASGHLLVMPRRHIGDLGELDDDESIALWEATRKAIKAIEQAYHPNGLNFGANLGRAAGAGIPRHVHIHVLPRWHGDTNFMTTIAATRVLPESLPDTWARVRAAWPS